VRRSQRTAEKPGLVGRLDWASLSEQLIGAASVVLLSAGGSSSAPCGDKARWRKPKPPASEWTNVPAAKEPESTIRAQLPKTRNQRQAAGQWG